MRSVINVKIKSNKQITSPNINNQIKTNPKTMSEAFNKFLSTIAKDIDHKIIAINKTHKYYFNVSKVNSFFLIFINDEEVESLIKEMNTSKLVGPSSIPTNILKLSYSVLSKPLVKLINFSFSEGTFPDLLKFANVIPVFKKGDNLDYNNYRPISLISNIGKLIEMIVHKRLNQAIKFSRVHHSADDTNLMFADNSLKKINKHINYDLKLFTTWLRANRISLNTSKT